MANFQTAVQLFKDWDKFAAATDPTRFRFAMDVKMHVATKRNCEDVQNEIRRRIDGREYDKNSGLTILLKASSKPLVGGTTGYGGSDVGGTLLKSLGNSMQGAYVGFIGVVRSRGGANVALIVHQGAVLKMTTQRRKWLAMAISKAMKRQGMTYSRRGEAYTYAGGKATPVPGSSSNIGAQAIVIPARPFITKAMQDPALQKRLIDRWAAAAAEALKVK